MKKSTKSHYEAFEARKHLGSFQRGKGRGKWNGSPLSGKKILITRARDQATSFAFALEKFGAQVIEFPTIEIVPPTSWDDLDRAIDRIEAYDWLIFTSANGVHFFWQRWKERNKDYLPPRLKICAIGPATAHQLKQKGAPVHYIPKKFVAEAILEGFESVAVKGKRILLARAKEARDLLPKGLTKMGAEVDVVEVYRTVKPRGGAKKLRGLLTKGKIDVITFTSSSTVNHFAELLKNEDLQKLLEGKMIACIGPITAQTAKKWKMSIQIQPKEYTIPALTKAIVNYISRKQK